MWIYENSQIAGLRVEGPIKEDGCEHIGARLQSTPGGLEVGLGILVSPQGNEHFTEGINLA